MENSSDKDGVADLAVLKRALTPDVLLVSVIGVNNETGAVNDVETIAELKREFCPEAALHVDYVQGWNRLPLQLDNSGIDLSFSGHKIHGPKGIGLLYCREGLGCHHNSWWRSTGKSTQRHEHQLRFLRWQKRLKVAVVEDEKICQL